MPRRPAGQTRERVYQFVRRRLLEGDPPTVREVQSALGFRAVETARTHLRSLVSEGRLTQAPGRSRGYRLPDIGMPGRGLPTVPVPILGRVQAGDLTTAVEEADGYLEVHSRSDTDELLALRVRGESMSGAGILPGDFVVVRRQSTAEPGQIVVALVGEEATVKTFRRRGDRIELHPENPAFDPIVPEPDGSSVLVRTDPLLLARSDPSRSTDSR